MFCTPPFAGATIQKTFYQAGPLRPGHDLGFREMSDSTRAPAESGELPQKNYLSAFVRHLV